MTRIPVAVPNAESYQPQRPLLIPCRTCNQSIAVNLTESDFEDGNGTRQASISKTVECPNCSTMNTRYFSWENEFGETSPHPFAAVQTTLLGLGDDLDTHDDDEALWEAETLQQENLEMEGMQHIGTDESWLELAWNLHHRVAFLTLYTAEGDTPIKCWQRRITIPQMRYEAATDVLRHIFNLAHLIYSFYAAGPDAVDLVPQMADTLLDFRLFTEGL